MTAAVRPELPPMPDAIAALPTHRGYPVPWFVEHVDGVPDFRIMRESAVRDAWTRHLCWICGQPLGPWVTFVAGPMCAVNRNSAEPPTHRECGEWSAQACPFLVRPKARRRDSALPDGTAEPDGIMLRRNPGVAMCWHTSRAKCRRREPYWLFDIGDPISVTWWAEGRPATRTEVLASIESGLPMLAERAAVHGAAGLRRLDKMAHRARKLLPAA